MEYRQKETFLQSQLLQLGIPQTWYGRGKSGNIDNLKLTMFAGMHWRDLHLCSVWSYTATKSDQTEGEIIYLWLGSQVPKFAYNFMAKLCF